MNKKLVLLVAALAVCLTPLLATAELGQFERVEAKTFAKDKFDFPSGVSGQQLNVLFLGMSANQEDGEYQQVALLEWYASLQERGVFSANVKPYHFLAMQGIPWFVKGMVIKKMAEPYEGQISLDQAAVLFIDDIDEFAAAVGLPADPVPTIVLANPSGVPLTYFRGDVSAQGVDEVVAAIEKLLEG